MTDVKYLQKAVIKGLISEEQANAYYYLLQGGKISIEEIEQKVSRNRSDRLENTPYTHPETLNKRLTLLQQEICDPEESTEIVPFSKRETLFGIYDGTEVTELEEPSETIQEISSQDKYKELKQLNFASRYSIQGILDRGGMGTLYRAIDKVVMRPIALKVCTKRPNDPVTLEQFIKEGRLNGVLTAPGILPIYEVGILEENEYDYFPHGAVYYTMRLIEAGGTLTKKIRSMFIGEKRDYSRIVDCFLKICDSINLAHNENILHCDLKPDNILLSPLAEEVFVIDWGLAKLVDKDENYNKYSYLYDGKREVGYSLFTHAGALVGTPQYMSPEQSIGDIKNFNYTTDIYGLGGILYFSLTGFPPNAGESLHVTLYGLQKSHRDLHFPENTPSILKNVCSKCLELSQENRFQNVQELISELCQGEYKKQAFKCCPDCGDSIFGIDSKFCTNCGTKIKCLDCGHSWTVRDKNFCPQCGAKR